MTKPVAILKKRGDQRQRMMRRLAPLAARASGVGAGEPGDLTAHLPERLRLRLVRAGLEITSRGVAVSVAATALLAIAGGTAGGPALALLLPAGAMVAAAMTIEWRATRNVAAFTAALPLLLDSIQQLLKVGNSSQQAFTKACASASPALTRFLAPALHRIQHGMPLADGLNWAAERVEIRELRMFAAAVTINSRHGGSISATLANLSRILRQAARIERELRAATAETRFSGLVLGAMPLVIAAIITSINSGYIAFFFETHDGRKLALIALLLQLSGMGLMRRLMRLDF